jgi:hypothetical protein
MHQPRTLVSLDMAVWQILVLKHKAIDAALPRFWSYFALSLGGTRPRKPLCITVELLDFSR